MEYNEDDEEKLAHVERYLNYPCASDDLYLPLQEDVLTSADAMADDAVRMM